MPSMSEAASIRDVAARHAYVFDNGLSSPDFFKVEQRMASEEFQLLRQWVKPEWDVLEVGCFTGLNLLGLAERGHTGWLVGVDFVLGAVRWLQEQARQFPNVLAYIDTFPHPHRQPVRKYDVVVCFDVLEHQQNVGQFLDGVAGALLPGGLALILVPIGKAFYDCGHCAFFPDEECLRNVLDYHLEVHKVYRLTTCDKMFAVCSRRE